MFFARVSNLYVHNVYTVHVYLIVFVRYGVNIYHRGFYEMLNQYKLQDKGFLQSEK